MNGSNLLSGRPSPGLSGGGVLRGCSIDKDTYLKRLAPLKSVYFGSNEGRGPVPSVQP